MRFLKPIPRCPQCAQDWTHQQADDFPAYVSILVTGHLMAPLIIALVSDADLSVPALMAVILPLAMTLMIGLLHDLKRVVSGKSGSARVALDGRRRMQKYNNKHRHIT